MSLAIDCLWQFYVTYGVTTTEVFPQNWNECTLTDTKYADEIFYRRNFEGKLIFGGSGTLCRL